MFLIIKNTSLFSATVKVLRGLFETESQRGGPQFLEQNVNYHKNLSIHFVHPEQKVL